jgi:hypothetical protein
MGGGAGCGGSINPAGVTVALAAQTEVSVTAPEPSRPPEPSPESPPQSGTGVYVRYIRGQSRSGGLDIDVILLTYAEIGVASQRFAEAALLIARSGFFLDKAPGRGRMVGPAAILNVSEEP